MATVDPTVTARQLACMLQPDAPTGMHSLALTVVDAAIPWLCGLSRDAPPRSNPLRTMEDLVFMGGAVAGMLDWDGDVGDHARATYVAMRAPVQPDEDVLRGLIAMAAEVRPARLAGGSGSGSSSGPAPQPQTKEQQQQQHRRAVTLGWACRALSTAATGFPAVRAACGTHPTLLQALLRNGSAPALQLCACVADATTAPHVIEALQAQAPYGGVVTPERVGVFAALVAVMDALPPLWTVTSLAGLACHVLATAPPDDGASFRHAVRLLMLCASRSETYDLALRKGTATVMGEVAVRAVRHCLHTCGPNTLALSSGLCLAWFLLSRAELEDPDEPQGHQAKLAEDLATGPVLAALGGHVRGSAGAAGTTCVLVARWEVPHPALRDGEESTVMVDTAAEALQVLHSLTHALARAYRETGSLAPAVQEVLEAYAVPMVRAVLVSRFQAQHSAQQADMATAILWHVVTCVPRAVSVAVGDGLVGWVAVLLATFLERSAVPGVVAGAGSLSYVLTGARLLATAAAACTQPVLLVAASHDVHGMVGRVLLWMGEQGLVSPAAQVDASPLLSVLSVFLVMDATVMQRLCARLPGLVAVLETYAAMEPADPAGALVQSLSPSPSPGPVPGPTLSPPLPLRHQHAMP
jgi:hypothetical protein